MYLKRKADTYLNAWKSDPSRSPLIIKGPRQVGKIETIDYFIAHNYRSIMGINFVKEPKYRAVTTDGYGANTIVRNISPTDPAKRLIPGDTFIFFDEIRAYPDTTTTLKFFEIDGKYDMICSGSALGTSYKQVENNSAGYKTDYEMRSLDFEEFLWARGHDEAVTESVFTHLCDATPFSEVGMNIPSMAFVNHCVLSGMSAVVTFHIHTGAFEETLQLQRQLTLDCREDIRKYAQGLDQARILSVFNHIPVQLAKESKRFQISKVASGTRFKDYRRCVE